MKKRNRQTTLSYICTKCGFATISAIEIKVCDKCGATTFDVVRLKRDVRRAFAIDNRQNGPI